MSMPPKTASEQLRRQMEELSTFRQPSAMQKTLAEQNRNDPIRDIAKMLSDAESRPFVLGGPNKQLDDIARQLSDSLNLTGTGGDFKPRELLAQAMKNANVGATISGGGVSMAKVVSNLGPIKSITDLAPLVRKARKSMKMNQQQFADAAGVGRRFLSELENGKPSLEFDKVLACALAAGIDIIAKPRRPL
jgi:y4mF family transcriptional regulator